MNGRMENPGFRMLQTLISLSLFSSVATQVCDNKSYTTISNPRRSTKATYDNSLDVAICDNGIDEGTWFRFDSYSGDAIVERDASDPVPMLQCGTQAPIYIQGLGSHPVNDYETKAATVCANHAGNPCNWMETIQIHRCPGYYLYKLKSPPGCSIAYCVGDKDVVNRGEYVNGFAVGNFPEMIGSPIFSGYFVNGSGLRREIYFKCNVQYDRQPDDANARFRITFLFDGQPLEYIGQTAPYPPERLQSTLLTPDSSDLVAVLDERHLRGRLGREISCQAESFWDGNTEVSPIMRSLNKYYAAFESTVKSYSVSLTSGSTFDVTFQSTLPLTCSHCIDASCCRYKYQMLGSTASSPQCFMVWEAGDTAVAKVYFVPEATASTRHFTLSYDKYNDDILSVSKLSLWHDYIIPPVPMTVVSQPEQYRRCISVGDPHMSSFDKRDFEMYLIGIFYLTKTRSVNGQRQMEVQIRHEVCWNTVSCPCGVVVREGNTAYKISICGSGTWGFTQRQPTVVRLLSQNPPDSSAVFRDGTGRKFSVRMPSGLRVEIALTMPSASVTVHLPPVYHGQTDPDSICCNSNGNKFDDIVTNKNRFRVPDSLNYFKQQPVCGSFFNPAPTSCGCSGTNPICSNNDPTLNAISKANTPLSKRWTSGIVCPQNPAAAATLALDDSSNSENDFILDDDILFPPYIDDPDFGVNVSFTWPTPKGKTEADAEQYCSDIFQSSPAYADCSANEDLATTALMCKTDLQISDDYNFVSSYASVFEENCLNSIAASINSTSNSSDSNSALEALTSLSGELCPDKCNGKGTCSEGNCICNTGYIGADCSIDQTLPPSLTSMTRGGACDVRNRPCDVISVYGSGVASSSAVKCRFTDQNTGAQTETDGEFIIAGEYSCPVPETTTHRRRRSVTARTSATSTRTVSITIDGVLYSNVLNFVLYDSVCMECGDSETCQQKDDSCLISDECFADNATNPDDSCLQCVPSASKTSWKDVTVVESWNVCTRDCDVGVATRNYVCSNKIVKEEVDFCEVQNCPEIGEQEKQGFGIKLSSEDLKLILLDPVGSLVPFSDALNQYCSKNAAACCNSVGIPTQAPSVSYTSPELLTYASGYPVVDSTDTSLKIIAKIDLAQFGAECSQTQNQGSNIVYADAKLIYNAVNSEKSKIEQALSITITSVWSGNSDSSAQRSSTSVGIIYNLIGFWVFIILVQNNIA